MSASQRLLRAACVVLVLLLLPQRGLCGQEELPWQTGDLVWNSWRVVSLDKHPEFIRYKLKKNDQLSIIEITYRRSETAWSTRYYQVQPAPGQQPRLDLLKAVKAGLEKFEKVPGHDRLVIRHVDVKRQDSGQVAWQPHRIAEYMPGRFWKRLLSSPTYALEVLIFLGFILVASRFRKIVAYTGRIGHAEWLFLSVAVAGGAVLRALGGVRVPGFTNWRGYAHGFGMLRDVLVWDPLMVDPHGNGFYALYDLVLSVFPRTELSVVYFQFAFSVACIPLVYLVSRYFLGRRSWALWASAVIAVLPAQLFFATTEIRLLPGVFFMLVSLACLGLAMSDRDLISLFASVVTGVVATQFYPTLMPLPLLMLVLCLARVDGRALLRKRVSWLAAGLFMALWIWPAIWMIDLVAATKNSVVGTDFIKGLADSYRIFIPSNSYAPTGRYNVFLNNNFTPPSFWILALGGFLAGMFKKDSRYVTLAFLFAALLLSVTGLFPGRMNLARLQQGGLPFYAMLAGAGLGFLLDRLGSTLGRQIVRFVLGATIVLGSVIVWPGPTGAMYTLQYERRAFIRALDHLEDNCSVIWAPGPNGTIHDVPIYLAEQRGRRLDWGALKSTVVPRELLENDSCLYYYRTSTCFTVGPEEKRTEALRPECAAVEKQLAMKELFVEPIPGIPDDMSTYSRRLIPVGFYRVESIR